MSVWLTIPSKRPPEEAGPLLKLWRERGYKIALWCDSRTPGVSPPPYIVSGRANFVRDEFTYPGYAVAVNSLIAEIVARDPDAQWFIAAGDDIEPDLNHTAEEIAFECGRHFGEEQQAFRDESVMWLDMQGINHTQQARMHWSTFGVMQPTGDRWGEHDGSGMKGAYIDRVCGSAWLGREFCRRMYGGRGPLWPEYRHMYVDQELQEVAVKLGVLWQRRDLIQLHRHWARKPNTRMNECPAFLREVNSQRHWRESGELFRKRHAAGFPGHEPIP